MSGSTADIVFALRGERVGGAGEPVHGRAPRRLRLWSGTRLCSSVARPTGHWCPRPRCSTASPGPTPRPSPPPAPRWRPATDRTYGHALGGRNLSADKNTAAAERFDPSHRRLGEDARHADTRSGLGATYLDGRTVAAGGEEPTRVLGVVEVYDIDTGTLVDVAAARRRPTRHDRGDGSAPPYSNGATRPTHTGIGTDGRGARLLLTAGHDELVRRRR